ncbi:NAD-dependent epimerase/dehydratase family protein [Brucella pituitosa]|uniref:NAD(P)-dependent oxidoreductase n=1 Tax=Brucella pituitosa TaxID=571256 RepID=A0ABS3JVX7_9HYPH|nr:NAD(P)-dependent oxidoreductase [Brucella pituitosa]MBO1038282.1 NAD(P)-dependent oxidoreductase [Brucella pituitosa]
MKKLLLTGASGNLGRMLAPRLAQAGYRLRLSDIAPFPDELPEGAEFIQADLTDAPAIADLVRGTDTILHFGGISVEQPYDLVAKANLIGVTHIFEAARAEKQRVIFASSNHTIGFYTRDETLSTDEPFRPDGYYGLSKAYGELLGRMMFDKHGIESVHLRIGSCVPEPTEARHLSTWLSHDDLVRLLIAAIEAPETNFAVVWGISANASRWWEKDDAARIGYVPQDDASRFGDLAETGDPVSRRFQGGTFTAHDYSRED